MLKGEIEGYAHPYLTVDGVVLRFGDFLEVLLTQREEPPFAHGWSLPGGFVDIDKRLDHVLVTKIGAKTGVDGYYMEQLKTYDSLDRDPRGRIVSVAYLALTSNFAATGQWFRIEEDSLVLGEIRLSFSDLAFDHGQILRDGLERLKNKLWYSDIAGYLLPSQFTVRQIQVMFQRLEGKKTNSFRRRLGQRVVESGGVKTYGQDGGRPAALLSWNRDWKGD